MCMYYLYKQLERIVNVHLCNKCQLSKIVIRRNSQHYVKKYVAGTHVGCIR